MKKAFPLLFHAPLAAFLFGCTSYIAQVPAPKKLTIVDRSALPPTTKAELKKKAGERKPEKPVLVGIRVSVEEVTIKGETSLTLEDLTPKKKTSLPAGDYKIAEASGRITVDGRLKSKKLRFESNSSGSFLQMNGKAYRGALIVREAEGKITVVNELEVDDYLKGVLPREVVVTWPEESLRAQAVASRTYLASHLNKHTSEGFDLCSDVHCQVYGGVGREHPNTSKAVEDTHLEILTYGGKPLRAFFHSNCGGMTEHVSSVWGLEDAPYLPRKKCGFGTADPRYHWQAVLHDKNLLSALEKSTNIRGATLKSIRVKTKSSSGRAQGVAVTTDKGTFTLPGNEFRIALNPEIIRSTLWTNLARKKGAYLFQGRGWGHGVGFCQWGAKGMAEQGRSYTAILKFYYPHAQLELWNR